MTVATTHRQRKVITKIECKEKLSKFIATIDDLLFSASIAEKTIEATTRVSEQASQPSTE